MIKIDLSPNFYDDRGEITDLLTDVDINSITMITFKKGAVRANHYHKKTIQWNYVLSGKIIFVSKIKNKIKKIIGKKGDFVKIDTKEFHAIKAISKA